MKTFKHAFDVATSREKVAAFHRSSSSLKAITPRWFFMSNVDAPLQLSDGDEMAFTLWLGPLPVRWHARLENVSESGFDDVQIRGPYASWVHTHRFEAIDSHQTQVLDDVTFAIRRHWFWGPIGFLMAMGLPILFFYRARKTRAILEER